MVSQKPYVDSFTQFAVANEGKLRLALIAACGGERGREVAVEALAYGWEHWERLQKMDNPVGYLYRVGRNLSRRQRLPGPMFLEVPDQRMPDIEPALPQALAYLSERQRTAVVLVHSYQWTLSEVAELMGISKTTVQNHLERGMASLRRQIGGVE